MEKDLNAKLLHITINCQDQHSVFLSKTNKNDKKSQF